MPARPCERVAGLGSGHLDDVVGVLLDRSHLPDWVRLPLFALPPPEGPGTSAPAAESGAMALSAAAGFPQHYERGQPREGRRLTGPAGEARSSAEEHQMVICTKCGQTNDRGDAFCGRCGAFLEWTGQPAGAPETPPPVTPTAGRSSRRVPPEPRLPQLLGSEGARSGPPEHERGPELGSPSRWT
jgi:hypothetical protein